MRVLSYNARGVGNPQFKQTVRQLVADHKPMVLIITEPRISGRRAETVRNSLGFDQFVFVDPISYSGGIWMLWQSHELDVQVLTNTQHEITITVKYRQMRRKEQDRLARMDADYQKRKEIAEFAMRREERLKAAEERTAKKRLKRQKKKQRKKEKKIKSSAEGEENGKEESSADEGDSDNDEEAAN